MTEFPAADIILLAIFLLFVATTAAGAVIAASSVRVIRGVCGLAMCSIGLAGCYYFLNSPFLALMEILIYIGAVCVTIVFAIMLAEPEESTAPDKTPGAGWWSGLGLLAGLGLFAGLATGKMAEGSTVPPELKGFSLKIWQKEALRSYWAPREIQNSGPCACSVSGAHLLRHYRM